MLIAWNDLNINIFLSFITKQFCHNVKPDCEGTSAISSGDFESSGDIQCVEGCDCPGQMLYNGTDCVPYQKCSCLKPGTDEIACACELICLKS